MSESTTDTLLGAAVGIGAIALTLGAVKMLTNNSPRSRPVRMKPLLSPVRPVPKMKMKTVKYNKMRPAYSYKRTNSSLLSDAERMFK